MDTWTRFRATIESYRDLWIECLRIFLGIGLFLRGLWFVSHIDGVVDMVRDASGSFAYAFVAQLVAGVQIVGGLFLALGLLTRLSIVALMPVVLGAVFLVEIRTGPFTEGARFELAVFVLVTLVVLWLCGPGPLSLDARLQEAWQRKRAAGAGAPAPVEQPA